MKLLSIFALIVVTTLVLGLAALWLLRRADARAVEREWNRLAALANPSPAAFDPTALDNLPEPAQRYLKWALRPGAPLARVAVLEMTGHFGLGDKTDPKYQPMRARQILVAPDGFVWDMRTIGGLPLAGSDTGEWTRFALAGFLPVARMGGTTDHRRSAFGRLLAEAAVWSPASLLIGSGVDWSAPAPHVVRISTVRDGVTHAVDLHLAPDGAPLSFGLERWSNANPEKRWQAQPFGGVLSDYREVQGHRLPFHVEAGNFFGTPGYFPFFIADVTAIRFPG